MGPAYITWAVEDHGIRAWVHATAWRGHTHKQRQTVFYVGVGGGGGEFRGYSREHSRKLRGIIFLSMADWFSVWCVQGVHVHVSKCGYMFSREWFVCPPPRHSRSSSSSSLARFLFLHVFDPHALSPIPCRVGPRSAHLLFILFSASVAPCSFVPSPRSEDESDLESMAEWREVFPWDCWCSSAPGHGEDLWEGGGLGGWMVEGQRKEWVAVDQILLIVGNYTL